MKKKIQLLIVCCALTSFCFAQVIGEEKSVSKPIKERKKTVAKPVPVQLVLNLQANRAFYLTVNKKSLGRVAKDERKTVNLLSGRVHSLTFEEAESTGENIERYIHVTNDMAKHRDSTYTIRFKKDYLEIIRSYSQGTQ